jgi:PAS domain S-box-containing protein
MGIGRRDRWVLLAFGLATVVAVVDALVGRSAVLIGALIPAPIVAAARAGPRATALVGAYAVCLAVVLGVPNHIFGHTDHLLRVGFVTMAAGLSVWVARLGELLRRSGEELRVILEGVADAITAQDASGRLVFANRAALESLGYESERQVSERSGQKVPDRFEILDEAGHPYPVDRLPGRLAVRGETPEPTVVRYRVRETGEERWSLIKARPVRDRAGEVRLAISISEDITEQKRAERSQRFLAEASRLLSESLDYEVTLRTVADMAVPDIADWCAVEVVDEEGEVQRLALAASDPTRLPLAEDLRRRYPADPQGDTGISAVLRTGGSELYEDVTDEMLAATAQDAEHLTLLRAVGLRSAMIVPMVARGRAVGVITFVSSHTGRRYDAEALAFAEELGRRAGTAVENARLYEERSYIARALQESLLPPSLPDLAGVELAARFRPAGAGNEVGGDFYDVFHTGDSGWAVVMGDVCGKGAGAAAVTALARYTLRAAAMQQAHPSAVLHTLNEAIIRQRGGEQFCTVAFAQLESVPGGLQATMANGGHPPPLLLRSDGSVEGTGQPGTLLGVLPDPELHDRGIALSSGDALVLYTDGVTDAHAPARILSPADLAAVLGECAGLAAPGIAERLERAAVDAVPEAPRDDVAILVLRVV